MSNESATAENGATEKKFTVSRRTLQILAVVTMIIDHLCYSILIPYFGSLPAGSGGIAYKAAIWTRWTVGRFAFPVYCFFLAEGFFRTRNRGKYFARLAGLLVLSELPFDLALFGKWEPEAQSVMFTLVIAFLVMAGQEKTSVWVRRALHLSDKKEDWQIQGEPAFLTGLLHLFKKQNLPVFLVQLLLAAVGMGLGILLKTDYSWHGVLLADIFFLGKYWNLDRSTTLLLGYLDMYYEPFALISFFMIKYYDDKEVKRSRYGKAIYSLAYPVHLAILAAFRLLVFKV